jgi:indole-3-glycerol phosphate synthase
MKRSSRIPSPSPASAGDFLTRMAAASSRRAALAAAALEGSSREGSGSAEEVLARRIARLPAAPALRLSPQGFDVIAEVKRRSPSAGALAGKSLRVPDQARRYVAGGAAALSVLTEPGEFHGHLDHLVQATATSGSVPALRKDFLVAPLQVMEARAAGAGGVLLIAAMLDDRALKGLLDCVLSLGMFALVEIFDRAELDRVLPLLKRAGPAVDGDGRVRLLLGVNCRDLRTLKVDFGRFAQLAPHLPRHLPRVAESGVDSPALAARVAELGYDLALVGTALMRSAEPGALLAELLEAGRASALPAVGR